MLDDDQADDEEFEPAPPEPDYELPTLGADLHAPWRERAACKGKPTWWWYPTRGEVPERALAVCRACPVRQDCLTAGLNEAHGHWGGESERGRRRIKQHRTIRAQRAARGLT